MTETLSAAAPAILEPFFDATARGELRFPECGNCGRFQWYPRPLCPACLGAQFRWTQVEPRGVVYSYTVVRERLGGSFGPDYLPYTVVQVQLTSATGINLVANLEDESQANLLRVGIEVDIHFGAATPSTRIFPVVHVPISAHTTSTDQERLP